MKQSAFHLPKINYTKIYRTPSKNFCTKYIFSNIPKLVFYFYIFKIIAPELFIILKGQCVNFFDSPKGASSTLL